SRKLFSLMKTLGGDTAIRFYLQKFAPEKSQTVFYGKNSRWKRCNPFLSSKTPGGGVENFFH
ncbi:hypothetical protein KKD49_05195, partial [Myxococcota bacterium]|nr:hypothetical protein [Myxococcota bacterium]